MRDKTSPISRRWKCPYCDETYSSYWNFVDHIADCDLNPEKKRIKEKC